MLKTTCTHKFYPRWSVSQSSLAIFRSHVDVYSLYRGIYFTFALLGCVRYNEDFVESRFVISRLTVFHTGREGGGGEVSPRKSVVQSPCQFDVTSRVSDFQNGEQSVHLRDR